MNNTTKGNNPIAYTASVNSYDRPQVYFQSYNEEDDFDQSEYFEHPPNASRTPAPQTSIQPILNSAQKTLQNSQDRWMRFGSLEINLSVVLKILTWKTFVCQNGDHYLRNGGVSELSKECTSYHGDQIDRRRPLLTPAFHNEVSQNYPSNQSQTLESQCQHLSQVILHMGTQNLQQKNDTLNFYFAYTNKLCSNWEHFQSKQSPPQYAQTEKCKFSHNQNEINFHPLSIEQKIVRPIPETIFNNIRSQSLFDSGISNKRSDQSDEQKPSRILQGMLMSDQKNQNFVGQRQSSNFSFDMKKGKSETNSNGSQNDSFYQINQLKGHPPQITQLLDLIKSLEAKSNQTMSLIVQEKNSSQQVSPHLDQIYNIEQTKRSDLTSLKRIVTSLKIDQGADGNYRSHSNSVFSTGAESANRQKSPTNSSENGYQVSKNSNQMTLFQSADASGRQHLNLEMFKVQECHNQEPHNPKKCPRYHGQLDKRRCTTLINYGVDFCPVKSCTNPKCKYTHNKVERLYHIEKYKTKFCTQSAQKCDYKQFCSFAHSDQDIKTPLIHKMPRNQEFFMFYFKTEWCPFNTEHNKAQCVYAHNWQDFRRKPHLFSYNPFEICEQWQAGNFIGKYEEGCPLQSYCGRYHGWKEQIFHPMIYKTIFCDEAEQKYPDQKLQQCQKNLQCGYYHSEKDRRTASLNDLHPKKNQPFELMPIDPKNPHNSIVVTNPNQLNHLLRSYHVSLNISQKLWGFDLDSLHQKFNELGISTLLLRFIEQRGVVPNHEMNKQRMLSNQQPTEALKNQKQIDFQQYEMALESSRSMPAIQPVLIQNERSRVIYGSTPLQRQPGLGTRNEADVDYYEIAQNYSSKKQKSVQHMNEICPGCFPKTPITSETIIQVCIDHAHMNSNNLILSHLSKSSAPINMVYGAENNYLRHITDKVSQEIIRQESRQIESNIQALLDDPEEMDEIEADEYCFQNQN